MQMQGRGRSGRQLSITDSPAAAGPTLAFPLPLFSLLCWWLVLRPAGALVGVLFHVDFHSQPRHAD
jgi:hypothetical protein